MAPAPNMRTVFITPLLLTGLGILGLHDLPLAPFFLPAELLPFRAGASGALPTASESCSRYLAATAGILSCQMTLLAATSTLRPASVFELPV